MLDDENKIVSEKPDYENQTKILEEEHRKDLKRQRWYVAIASMFVFIVLIFYVSYSTMHVYREYTMVSKDNCENVNIKVDGSPTPNVNIYIAHAGDTTCKPMYNVDYQNNRVATFNIDVYGDGTFIYNKVNQMSSDGKYCVLNCDKNSDGWPDYNIDLNGDGTADINIVTDPENSMECDKNCDINFDTLPDVNVEVNEVVINKTNKGSNVPVQNVDYKGNKQAVFNVDGSNPINVIEDGVCKYNCDIDNDGWPDYNIKLTEKGTILNELITKGTNSVYYTDGINNDWKCALSGNLDTCNKTAQTNDNFYINIDIDGDGKADVNISTDKGQTLINEIGKNDNTLNIDANHDGFPDYNIDIDNDGKADLNIIDIDSGNFTCLENCDYNHDGKADYLVDKKFYIANVNVDKDYDGKCNVNCDLDNDLIPDLNIDTDGDTIPDINIDYNHDGKADFNIDRNGDYKPDYNLDAYGTGECTFNCITSEGTTNVVSKGSTCEKNCDTNNDGWPDKNVYIGNECKFNCNGEINDIDNNYYLDSEYNSYGAILAIDSNSENDFYIINPVDIKANNIEPGWDATYVVTIKNTSYYGIAYKLVWKNVVNEYTDANNVKYSITYDGVEYINSTAIPLGNLVLKNNQIIKNRNSIQFVLKIAFIETGEDQSYDSGKTFKGNLTIEPIK